MILVKKYVVSVHTFKHIWSVCVPSLIVSIGTRRYMNGQLDTLATLKTPWPQSASELYRHSGRRRSAKLVPTFSFFFLSRGQRNGSPRPLNLCFIDLEPLLIFIQVAPQLTSRGWVDTVPDPQLLRKSDNAVYWTRDFCICSQKLWTLDHRGLATLLPGKDPLLSVKQEAE
jgi:hypothetical protein